MFSPSGETQAVFTKKRILIAAGTVLLLAAIIGVIWLASLSRAATAPIRTSEAFLNGLFNRRVDEAYALTSDDFKEETNKEEFAQIADVASKGLKYDTLKILPGQGEITETERGKLATLRYEVEGNDAVYDMSVKLINEKGLGWLVVSIENFVKE